MKALEKSFASLTMQAHRELRILGVSGEDLAVFISTLSVSMKENMPLLDQHLAGRCECNLTNADVRPVQPNEGVGLHQL